jgi:hypothetical protein
MLGRKRKAERLTGLDYLVVMADQAVGRDAAPPLRVIGEGASAQTRNTGERIRYTFDRPECRGWSAQGRGQQRGQQRRRYLVAHIGEETRAANAYDPRTEPQLRMRRLLIRVHRHGRTTVDRRARTAAMKERGLRSP